MMRIDELLEAIAELRRSDLEAWIEDELVVPQREAAALVFSERQCARIRLLCTLRYELEVDPDTLPLVVTLVDELYDTRRRLLTMTAAVTTQDEAVQAAILQAIERVSRRPSDAATPGDQAG